MRTTWALPIGVTCNHSDVVAFFYNCTITFLGDGAQKATAFEHIILLSNYAVHVFGLHNYQALVPQPYVVTMRI